MPSSTDWGLPETQVGQGRGDRGQGMARPSNPRIMSKPTALSPLPTLQPLQLLPLAPWSAAIDMVYQLTYDAWPKVTKDNHHL